MCLGLVPFFFAQGNDFLKEINIYYNKISVNVINFGCVSVNDLHLHKMYTPYIWLLTFTCTTLLYFSVGWFSIGDLEFKLVLSMVLTLRTNCSHFE